ncbi:MAG TPA: tRNA-dihydrouridine synthase family protein [Clostridia bacterium]|nr:tRNA-dihydrouridine synthase family protein [Clostridia bacterium]
MKITDLFENKIFLAPLAGFTDAGFRALAKKYGCGLTVTEMTSAKSLEMNNERAKELLVTTKNESPVAVQLFGHEQQVFEKVAQSQELEKFDIIDINMGCPMKKIIGNGDGSALLLNPSLASEIIKAVKRSGKFVTVKMRIGITDNKNAVNFAKMCEGSGADMLTVHGRTQKQMYSGKADWDTIASVVDSVKIPVVANGDVFDKQSYDKLLRRTNAYAVAVGRGCLGRPYIFAELLDKPYEFDILSAVTQHIAVLSEYLPERVVVNEMKKHICYYVKGLALNNAFCVKICNCKKISEMTEKLTVFLEQIKN